MSMQRFRPKRGPCLFVWKYIWGPLSLFGAFFPLSILNLLQFPSLLLLPLSPALYRRWNRAIAFMIWGWWAWSIQRLGGLRLELSGDELPAGESAIVFANHQGMSDIVVLLCLAFAKGRVGDAKWMVKDVIKYVPGVGWGMMFLGCIFLKRNWTDDEQRIKATFKRYVDHKEPLWLISFPEGTRVTPAKLAASQQFAAKAAMPPTSRVMLPRSKGFVASVHGLRDTVNAVYSVTICYPGGRAPTLPELIRGDVPSVQLHCKRTPIAQLSRDGAELALWLTKDFYAKDAWLAEAVKR